MRTLLRKDLDCVLKYAACGRFKKTVWRAVMCMVILAVATSCQRTGTVVLFLEEYKSGDAKFLNDSYIMTNKDGSLRLVRIDDREERILNCVSNWSTYVETDEGFAVIYANANRQVGILRLDKELDIVSDTLVFTDDDRLMIDPSVLCYNGIYYLTLTYIDGNVNNSDMYAENGIYTVSLYESRDLESWEFITDIISVSKNIEDVELCVKDGYFYFMYEAEDIDKGPSEIRVMKSENLGRSWTDGRLLVGGGSDNEPAAIIPSDDGFLVFYSSGAENLSYMGGEARVARFDDGFKLKSSETIRTSLPGGVLLYGARLTGGILKLLYSHDYLTTNDLCVESFHFR